MGYTHYIVHTKSFSYWITKIAKKIWRTCIPPSKSFVLWRLMHNKLPTDDNLYARGCILVSMCSLCGMACKTTEHLFLSCPSAARLWHRLQGMIGCAIDTISLASVLCIWDKYWSSQLLGLILTVVINVIWVIWHCRNKLQFDDKIVPLGEARNMILAQVSLVGNLTSGTMYSSVEELRILKAFQVNGHVGWAPSIKEVLWSPPPSHWVKCNTDGAARGAPSLSACGSISRGHRASTMGCFSANLGISYSLHAEFMGAILAMELAITNGWNNFWLECDSQLVVSAFKSSAGVPWTLANRSNNCIAHTQSMNFIVTHIFREGNICVDRLTAHGLHIQGFMWWDIIPSFVREDFFRNRFSLPSYRFK